MSRKVELEIVCDAPPYTVVQACSRIGVESPEDVRWCEAGNFLSEQHLSLPLRKHAKWNELRELLGPRHMACACGQPVPPLRGYVFTFGNGTTALYEVGQCGRCKRVYWSKS